MTIRFIRLFFLVLSAVCGFYLGSIFSGPAHGAVAGAVAGILLGSIVMLVEVKLKSVSLRNLSAAAFGLVFGFFMAWMVTLILRLIPMEEEIYAFFRIIFTLIFCYLGMIISIKGKDEFNIVIPYVRFTREALPDALYLLDTSVIIDGRIAALCDTGFLDGRLVIPRFVLQELQQVADSSDDLKRNRGRRGLDMLERLKRLDGHEVIIHEEGLSDIKGVDSKLVRLAKILDCPVLTNDFNLNKVAKLEGVKVLNINDLAGAMRPVVFPGEKIRVEIKKEGKEREQGVAFMDDGTMIVVDNARKFIGQSLTVSVTSVLQTSAGRMIFASIVERPSARQQNNQRQGKKRDGNRRSNNGRQRTQPEKKRDGGNRDKRRDNSDRDRQQSKNKDNDNKDTQRQES